MKAHRPTIMGTRHMVAATQYLAAEAGFKILEAGGNAIDAGVAAGISLGVVQPEFVNVAGVAPIMIYSAADNRIFTIPGLGPWPKALDRDYFKKNHGGKIPQGIMRTVVPAAPDAWITALERFGTMNFGEVAQSAIGYARDWRRSSPTMRPSIARFPRTSRSTCRRGVRRRRAKSSCNRRWRRPCNTWWTRR
jgi:gamma-glutamyltranspeptidase/glutathione hydrolase